MNLQQSIEKQIAFFDDQKKLLNSVFYWYLAPLTVGMILWFAGFEISSGYVTKNLLSFAIYFPSCALLIVGLWKVNKVAAAKEIQPLINNLQEQLSTIERMDNENEELN